MRLELKHPLPIRCLHWINFPVLTVMIWSGLLIYWANDVYEIKAGGKVWFHFFPDWFYDSLGVPSHLARGMAWHFAFMWLFAINGLLYVTYTIASGEWRHLIPNRSTFAEVWHVVLHDLHLTRRPLPRRKFNGDSAAGVHRSRAHRRRLASDRAGDLQAGPARPG